MPVIPGLVYLPQFITEAEETQLTTAIDIGPWDETWERRRQLYGASYGKAAPAERSIPPWAQALVSRLREKGIGDRLFDQMLVNEYLPGQGIAMHRDYEPFDRTVVSLSLLSPCVMDFRRVSERRREQLLLERLSLLVLSDVARYEWEHGIARRRNDRWYGIKLPRQRRLSVTFRMLKANNTV